MACRDAYKAKTVKQVVNESVTKAPEVVAVGPVVRLLFGVDSKIQADDILQNNINEYQWVTRNKIPPIFWGRNLVGENSLTRAEIAFLHKHGCKIAAIYTSPDAKKKEEQGKKLAKEIVAKAVEMGVPVGKVIFLEIDENEDATRDYMRGFARGLIAAGYTPGFKANTDAKFSFDREYSRGMQTDKDIFSRCLIWAVAPTLNEYDRMTTTHLIHPDNWKPYAPSAIMRNAIAVWQYGKDCHPIEDDSGKLTTFNLNLVRNEQVITEKMF